MCNRFLTLVGHIPSYIHVQCYSPDPLSDSVAEQTDSDVTIGQYVVSDRNPAGAILIRHKTQFDGEVRVCLFP